MPSNSTTSGSVCGSVIVPVYNEEATLGAALKRLLALSIERLEVIVVDDGSTDRTPSIVAEAADVDQRIRCFSWSGTPVRQQPCAEELKRRKAA